MVAGGAPAFLIAIVHVAAVVAHVITNRVLLTTLGFRFPVTLAVVQYAGIALALGFWTLFGLLRLRPLPIWGALRLAAGAALCSALANLSLRYNTLATFQAGRLTAAPAVWFVECILGVRALPTRPFLVSSSAFLVIGVACGVVVSDPLTTKEGAIWLVAAVCCTAVYQVCSARLRLTTKANELQLQLATKALGAVALATLAPIIDDYSISNDHSILYFEVDDTAALVLLLSAFLAFLSFIAQRASVARHSARAYNTLAYSVSVLIFAAHFSQAPPNAGVQLPLVISVLLSTLLFARTRDAFTDLPSSHHQNPPTSPQSVVVERPRSRAPPALRALARAVGNPLASSRNSQKRDRINTVERPAGQSASHSESELQLLTRTGVDTSA